jgi:hypothetical protein
MSAIQDMAWHEPTLALPVPRCTSGRLFFLPTILVPTIHDLSSKMSSKSFIGKFLFIRLCTARQSLSTQGWTVIRTNKVINIREHQLKIFFAES